MLESFFLYLKTGDVKYNYVYLGKNAGETKKLGHAKMGLIHAFFKKQLNLR